MTTTLSLYSKSCPLHIKIICILNLSQLYPSIRSISGRLQNENIQKFTQIFLNTQYLHNPIYSLSDTLYFTSFFPCMISN